jgi:membrane glycosyltransferase
MGKCVLQDTAPATARTPTGMQRAATILFRRIIFGFAAGLTCAALGFGILLALGLGGKSWISAESLIFFLSLLALPWYAAGLWNSLIGFWLLQGGERRLSKSAPFLSAAEQQPVQLRTAIIMTIRNEDPERAFLRLSAIRDSLDATGQGTLFDYFLLSDTSDDEIAYRERALARTWQDNGGAKLFYRRREVNAGFKAGNIRDFFERWGQDYDLALTLDADSVMSGDKIVELVLVMQAYPRLGILQSLTVGTPAKSAFARLFQFGMRHGMSAYTAGTAWWTADCGPYWGHNALIRVEPFCEFCELPELPGNPPFGGQILSHDQLEAALMRKAGFEVRVVPVEGGSYEDNPPSFLEFAKRDARWCLGNMQYLRCLFWHGLHFTSRIQIAHAIIMYLGSAAATLGIGLALALAAAGGLENVSRAAPLMVFALIYFLSLAPKLAGLLGVLLAKGGAARYGGAARLLAGAAVEILFSSILSVIMAVRSALFMASLSFGRTVAWGGQIRDARNVTWRSSAAAFWLETLLGTALLAGAITVTPGISLAMLFGAALALSIPFTVFTSSRWLSDFLLRNRICGIPEDFEPCEILDRIASAPCHEKNQTGAAAMPDFMARAQPAKKIAVL